MARDSQSASGATIAVNDTGIMIQNGKGASISLVGDTVDINLGALTVIKASKKRSRWMGNFFS